jgi:protein-disulfide isomerase
MHQRAAATATAASLALLLLACQQGGVAPGDSSSPEDGETVAEVFGSPITLGELDEWIKQDLFRRQTRDGNPASLYELRSQAIERLIQERILAAEAARRGVSPEEVIQLEVQALGEVTDEEVAAFYAENRSQMGEESLEEMTGLIRNFLSRRRGDEATAQLRARADVVVRLEAPRFEVAADGPARGPAGAPITIVEFSDFQCPYCQRVLPIMDEILAKYPDEVRLVYRHLPLESIHPRARAAAEAAACAQHQDGFWPYHDKLFANSRALDEEDLRRYAGEVGLDATAFDQCLTDGRFRAKVDADLAAARAVGISSTPTFLVNGILVSGAKPVAEFVKLIDAELAKASPNEG